MTTQLPSFDFLTLRNDGNDLNGILSKSVKPKNVLCMHIHGSWGNFYENPFCTQLSIVYNNAGFDYASVNLSGHDGGTISENFGESIDEIVSWINFLVDDETKIILQGHSLGALKLIRLASSSQYADLHERTAGLVLLSPFDLVAFYGGPNVERRRSHAKEFRDENGEQALVPKSIFDMWPISVKSYLELSEPEGDYDIFPTRLGEFGELDDTEIPRLVVLGEDDQASYPGAENVLDILEISTSSCELISSAPHNFAGCEDTLTKVVSNFIESLKI